MSQWDEQIDLALPAAPPRLPTATPPNPPAVMPGLAAATGVDLDIIDGGGQATMSRPDGERRESGPLARSVAERLAGSSAAVDAAGDRVTQRDDVANARIGGGAA